MLLKEWGIYSLDYFNRSVNPIKTFINKMKVS